MRQKIFTNCFLVKLGNQNNPVEVCLGMKKRGHGVGLWNGSGGKPEENENTEDAAIREVQEEFGVKVLNLDKRGEIDFVLEKENEIAKMYAYLVTEWENEPIETEEMKPKWFNISEVPYNEMWESDREWLPKILTGKKFKAKYTYSREGGKLKAREIHMVENL